MAKGIPATIHSLRQVKRPVSGRERTRNYRLRKKAEKAAGNVTETVTVTSPTVTRDVTSVALVACSVILAFVGMAMNGWFARSLASSDIAGWLFLALGICADIAALLSPSRASILWRRGERWVSMSAWLVWGMAFVFAIEAGIGFASVNIADVTTARAGRVTPAVAAAQAALGDAAAARDRECRGGVGKFCREREATVSNRQAALDAALRAVEKTGDPQTEAAMHVAAWLSVGKLTPSQDDFAMLRLVLLALLPQIGGILLMIGRAK